MQCGCPPGHRPIACLRISAERAQTINYGEHYNTIYNGCQHTKINILCFRFAFCRSWCRFVLERADSVKYVEPQILWRLHNWLKLSADGIHWFAVWRDSGDRALHTGGRIGDYRDQPHHLAYHSGGIVRQLAITFLLEIINWSSKKFCDYHVKSPYHILQLVDLSR